MAKNKAREMLETLQRVQAEFENYKKRVQRDQGEFSKFASQQLAQQLLPVLDHLTLALHNTTNHQEFVKGVRMIHTQLLSVLQQEGITPINTKGQFDPYKHEAILQEVSDQPSGIILEEMQKGYEMHGRVIRHAKVKISGGQDDKNDRN